MFTVDLLHEFELGVWKATFTHLICILFAAGENALQTLNIRYAMVICAEKNDELTIYQPDIDRFLLLGVQFVDLAQMPQR